MNTYSLYIKFKDPDLEDYNYPFFAENDEDACMQVMQMTKCNAAMIMDGEKTFIKIVVCRITIGTIKDGINTGTQDKVLYTYDDSIYTKL